jgi:hypothetical protein
LSFIIKNYRIGINYSNENEAKKFLNKLIEENKKKKSINILTKDINTPQPQPQPQSPSKKTTAFDCKTS